MVSIVTLVVLVKIEVDNAAKIIAMVRLLHRRRLVHFLTVAIFVFHLALSLSLSLSVGKHDDNAIFQCSFLCQLKKKDLL